MIFQCRNACRNFTIPWENRAKLKQVTRRMEVKWIEILKILATALRGRYYAYCMMCIYLLKAAKELFCADYSALFLLHLHSSCMLCYSCSLYQTWLQHLSSFSNWKFTCFWHPHVEEYASLQCTLWREQSIITAVVFEHQFLWKQQVKATFLVLTNQASNSVKHRCQS